MLSLWPFRLSPIDFSASHFFADPFMFFAGSIPFWLAFYPLVLSSCLGLSYSIFFSFTGRLAKERGFELDRVWERGAQVGSSPFRAGPHGPTHAKLREHQLDYHTRASFSVLCMRPVLHVAGRQLSLTSLGSETPASRRAQAQL
jgi:hypothetical protein